MEIDTWLWEALYVIKALHDHGKHEEILKSYREQTLSGEDFYEITLDAISSVFEDTRVYYNEDKEIEVFVFFDPVITEFYRLAEQYERERGIREEDDLFRQEMKRSLVTGLYFNDFDYGYHLYDHPDKPHGCRLVLLFGCDFRAQYEVAPGLLDIYEAYCQHTQRLKKELGVIPAQAAEEESPPVRKEAA